MKLVHILRFAWLVDVRYLAGNPLVPDRPNEGALDSTPLSRWRTGWTRRRLGHGWALWITSDTVKMLENFEEIFREIVIGVTGTEPLWKVGATDEAYSERIKRVYERLTQGMEIEEWAGDADTLARSALDALLRKMLGTEQFESLRRAVVLRAVKELGGNGR